MAATPTTDAPPAPDAGGGWRARAFGLEIEATFEAPGLPVANGPRQGPVTRIELASVEEIDAGWPREGTQRVLEEAIGEGPPARTIDKHPERGYRLYARHFGLATISASGDRVVCAPPEDEPWSWQRFLVGRVLPWAAVLRGREVFHASAVTCAGRAVGLVGVTGAGKTSLAVQLHMRGLEFLTDDVLALELRDGELRAHPGAAIVSVRLAEREQIPEATWSRLGTELGHSVKSYVELPRADAAVPLGALYFLTGERGPTITAIDHPDPPLLLASTFVAGVQTPERLVNQLEVCSAIARGIPLFRLRVSPEVGARDLAAIVHEHAEGLLAR